MLKTIVLLFLATTANAQTYDFDLVFGQTEYQGSFVFSQPTDTFSNVAISGNGVTFTTANDPGNSFQYADNYVWLLNPQNQTLGFQLVTPLGGAERTFTNVYINVNGLSSGCDPGPITCSLMSLKEATSSLGIAQAPEMDMGQTAAALTLLAGALLVWRANGHSRATRTASPKRL